MEKRVFLAIFLSFLVLVIYQTQFAPKPVPQDGAQTAATPSPTEPASPQAAAESTAGAQPPQPPVSSATPLVADAAARDIVVETSAVRMVFNTRGAVLTSFRLLNYRDQNGEPLELLPTDLPAGRFVHPFTISTDDAQQSATLAAALFQPSADGLSLGSSAGTLTFQYRDDSGLNARKTFEFQPGGQAYVLNFESSVDVSGAPQPITVAFGAGLGAGYATGGERFTAPRGLQYLDGSVSRLSASNVEEQPEHQGAFEYAGVDDHYFVAVALPSGAAGRVTYSAVTLPVPDQATVTRSFITFALRPETDASHTVALPFFIGPKDFDKLRAANSRLVYAIDFGMFASIVVPLLQALKWINGYLGNYGWSIVALTVIINILIFPLRHRSMVSMKKMQALQPEVKAIQDRYAKYKVTDPERQKMNSEMMALYKQRGVNPASGCLPMLLTMPILLAFYSLLGQAVELRGAPFFGWIHDLASKDPTYVWPILMGVTMFVQQRMTPTTADPVQQKVFMLLPVVFTVMFLSMPSGLVIYWLTSNLLTIAQQYLTNRIIGNAVPRPVRVSRKG
jgi:YidC/Oxa1 family membrane protein insertase